MLIMLSHFNCPSQHKVDSNEMEIWICNFLIAGIDIISELPTLYIRRVPGKEWSVLQFFLHVVYVNLYQYRKKNMHVSEAG